MVINWTDPLRGRDRTERFFVQFSPVCLSEKCLSSRGNGFYPKNRKGKEEEPTCLYLFSRIDLASHCHNRLTTFRKKVSSHILLLMSCVQKVKRFKKKKDVYHKVIHDCMLNTYKHTIMKRILVKVIFVDIYSLERNSERFFCSRRSLFLLPVTFNCPVDISRTLSEREELGASLSTFIGCQLFDA